jgi:hypothetical protein
MVRKKPVPLKPRRLEMSKTPKNEPVEDLNIDETTREAVTSGSLTLIEQTPNHSLTSGTATRATSPHTGRFDAHRYLPSPLVPVSSFSRAPRTRASRRPGAGQLSLAKQ